MAAQEIAQYKNFNPSNNKSVEEVLLASQQYMVYHAAHKTTAIRSPDGNPWIRCIGFTQTLDGARDLARRTHDQHGKMETRIMPCGKGFLIGNQRYNGLDLERRAEEQKKANELTDKWIAARQASIQETEARAASHAVLPEPKSPNTILPAEKFVPAGEPVPLNAKTETVTLQRVWACALIPDDGPENEPVVIPLFAADTLPELQELVKDAAKSKDLLHFDIFAGPTGEWMPLKNPSSSQTFHHHPLREEFGKSIKFEKM